MPLIFTDQLFEEARAEPLPSTYLLHRWALWNDEVGEAVREQLERAAALLPKAQRRLLRAQLSSSDEHRVKAAASGLLLASMLRDFGWSIEYERQITDGTPELRVSKRSALYVIAIRRVIGRARWDNDNRDAFERVVAELQKIQTRTPLFLRSWVVDPKASFAEFRRHVETLPPIACRRRQLFNGPGVLIGYETPTVFDNPRCAFGGAQPPIVEGDDRKAIEEATAQKVRPCQLPIIVALDLADCLNPFRDTEEVLYDQQAFSVAVDLQEGGAAGPMRRIRLPDGLADRAASRSRRRFEALLPFTVSYSARGFRMNARILANPYKPPSAALHSFDPIPRLLITATDGREVHLSRYEHGQAETTQQHFQEWFYFP